MISFPSVSRDSFSLWTYARVQTARSKAYFNGCPYIFLMYYYITTYMFLYHISMVSPLWLAVGPQSLRRIIYKSLNVCPFDYTAVTTSWMTDVAPTDRPKSLRNRCVSKFWWRFCVVTLLFGFNLWV